MDNYGNVTEWPVAQAFGKWLLVKDGPQPGEQRPEKVGSWNPNNHDLKMFIDVLRCFDYMVIKGFKLFSVSTTCFN